MQQIDYRGYAIASFAVWFARKVQAQARAVGVRQTAKNLRKQGVPLEYALALLVR